MRMRRAREKPQIARRKDRNSAADGRRRLDGWSVVKILGCRKNVVGRMGEPVSRLQGGYLEEVAGKEVTCTRAWHDVKVIKTVHSELLHRGRREIVGEEQVS